MAPDIGPRRPGSGRAGTKHRAAPPARAVRRTDRQSAVSARNASVVGSAVWTEERGAEGDRGTRERGALGRPGGEREGTAPLRRKASTVLWRDSSAEVCPPGKERGPMVLARPGTGQASGD